MNEPRSHPPIDGVEPMLLLVTHEHQDHNGVEAVSGDPTWVVPMHYRTPRIGFLDTADAFLERSEHVEHTPAPAFETSDLPATDGPLIVVPTVP
ncbi:MAG: hypothetical protein M3065_22370 [Actinomycetota bacterium]|nr:hypothetical protein [Actinomycetota bacterium]